MSDLKPCPFCGSSNLTIDQCWVDRGDEEISLIECVDCYGSAPRKIWNNRSPMAEVEEIMEEVKK